MQHRAPSRFYRLAQEALGHPRAGWSVAALACLLSLPSLWTGPMVDDYWLRAGLTGVPGVQDPRGPFSLFEFYRPDDVAELKACGALPWWTLPDSRFALLRPVASLTHWLDYALWPDRPALMHLENVLWLGALVLLVGHLHRQLLGATALAGLASLLYAIDDARAIAVGWIANRNGLLSAFFALGAFALHVRWRRTGSRAAALLGPVALLLGLLSNEGAVAVLAFFAAHGALLERGRPATRWLSVVPSALVVGGWRVAYALGGYGVAGSDRFVDPLDSPLRFAGAVLVREPALLLGQWGFPPSDLFSLPVIPPAALAALWALGLALAACVTLLLWPLLARDEVTRFCFAAMLLSLLPSCVTGPTDRLLLIAGVPATALLARLLVLLGQREEPHPLRLARRLARPFRRGLVAVHLILAPILFVANVQVLHLLWGRLERAIREAPLGDCSQKTLVVVNARQLLIFDPSVRGLHGLCVPRRMRGLGPANGYAVPLQLTRPDARTLVVRPAGGFRRGAGRFAAGDRVELPGMSVEIRRTSRERRPLEVAYTFDVALEDASLVWLVERGPSFERFTPPAIGESLAIDARGSRGIALDAREHDRHQLADPLRLLPHVASLEPDLLLGFLGPGVEQLGRGDGEELVVPRVDRHELPRRDASHVVRRLHALDQEREAGRRQPAQRGPVEHASQEVVEQDRVAGPALHAPDAREARVDRPGDAGGGRAQTDADQLDALRIDARLVEQKVEREHQRRRRVVEGPPEIPRLRDPGQGTATRGPAPGEGPGDRREHHPPRIADAIDRVAAVLEAVDQYEQR